LTKSDDIDNIKYAERKAEVKTDLVPARRLVPQFSIMKKSKPPEKLKHDFKNRPFKPLKGLVPSIPLPQKTITTYNVRKKTNDGDEDDASLFLRAAVGTKKFGNDSEDHSGSGARQAPKKKPVQAPEDSRLFLTAMQKIGTTFCDNLPDRELDEVERRAPTTSRMRQMKRGTLRISRELDLHGFLKHEALIRLERFVAAAYSDGNEAILVITGKGKNSPEGPVLQGAVEEWLGKKGKTLVAEFSQAPRALGGSGAFVVFLKKRSI
jgi:DNA-nicking Smr family endonuclease